MTSGSQDKDTNSVKTQSHLSLLKAELTKLQWKYQELQREHAILCAQSPHSQNDSFPSRLLQIVAKLHKQTQYSDLQIDFADGSEPAHRFVLSARSDIWKFLDDNQNLDWTDMEPIVGRSLLAWIYTDRVDFKAISDPDRFTLSLMKIGKSFQLLELLQYCQDYLMGSVKSTNCIQYYATADDIGAQALKEHCFALISTHWNEFGSEDFAEMTAPLLYSMLKSKSTHPLHEAIRLRREDVVLLYMIEFNHELSSFVNRPDEEDKLPLDIALSTKQSGIASTLIDHRANVDQSNGNGWNLIHLAIDRDDVFALEFLLDNNVNVNAFTPQEKNTALHLLADYPGLSPMAVKVIAKGANVNAQNSENFTPLHLAIQRGNGEFIDVLLEHGASTEIKSSAGFPPLWYALKALEDQTTGSNGKGTNLPEKLIAAGASVSTVCDKLGNSLLHFCAFNKLERSGLLLLEHSCDFRRANAKGETPLHLSAQWGLESMTRQLLDLGANANAQTIMSEENAIYRQTPLHLGILNRKIGVIQAIIQKYTHMEGDSIEKRPNLDLKNSEDQTPLSLALNQGLHDIAMDLLKGGASVNVMSNKGLTLLHNAISQGDSEGAIFLLNHGADIDLKTMNGESPIELAIKKHLPSVVECLCRKGANLSVSSASAEVPLWLALTEDLDTAQILVQHGVDTDAWSLGPDHCLQTLLHKAIDENLEDIACFLIRAGCDLNSPRKEGPNGKGGEEAHDLMTPLHLCCQWGLEKTVQVLLEHGANINYRDVEGKTPLHIAIENSHHPIINLLLSNGRTLDLTTRDKSGLSPFATAMTFRNNMAAQSILAIHPQAAEQYDNRGRNFLHTAIMKNDLESVLFLLSIHVNVNSRTQDANLLTPLLLAIQTGNEMIVRNLILAGAEVEARNTSNQSGLHVAAENNLPVICGVLINEGVDVNALDNRENNALHLAVKEGHLEVIKVLLTESNINAQAINSKGRNPLHVLAVFGKENSSGVFDLLLESIPQFPINKPDLEGNSPLLIAYSKGNGNLCRSLVKSGAVLGSVNHEGISIFNSEVATKQLLYGLLDFLSAEPKWGEGDYCQECNAKFGITTRRHHCRHCGRLVCAKCSDKDTPILKYNLTKPVRVCDICADVLTVGPGMVGS
ncbi:rabankyrin-5-like isoform X1 [Tigriopus californicus]|uniref:rabankyrin-5-like isoform X1 n=1 Tax=Tigriopus californicus TaxID=6832 RepID=UPI0027DA9C7C|nr:rabankyrin-5-like isoform X1 [Tigriopus californicus]